MALLARPGRRHLAAASLFLLLSPLFVALPLASALSVAPRIVGRGCRSSSGSARAPSGLFATSASRRSRPLPDFLTPVAGVNNSADSPRNNVVSATFSKLAHLVRKLRRPLLRVAIIFSIVAIGLKKGLISPAHARGKSAEPAVAVEATAAKSSWGKKLTKVIVTGGAVAAGAATANRVRSWDGDEKGSGIEIKDSAPPKAESTSPPPPLSAEWIEQELKEAEAEKPKPAQPKSKPPTSNKPNDAMITNLDSKIEMLRAREELAKATAEKKRQEDLEKAAEVRKQEQSEIDAKIAAFEQQQRLEQERVERIRKERLEREKQAREEQLSKLERVKIDKPQPETEKGTAGSGKAIENTAGTTGSNGSINVEQARRQPKSQEEEKRLQEKYGKMDLEERAFNILVDLGMVDLHSDPTSLDLSDDDEEGAFM